MPTYEYACKSCQHRFDIVQSFSEDALTTCPECDQDALRKVFSAAGIIFKGDGWHIKDYGDKKTTSSSTTATADEGSSSGSGATKKDDTSSSKSKSKKDTASSSSSGSSSGSSDGGTSAPAAASD